MATEESTIRTACVYAAIMLGEAGKDVNPEGIAAILDASGMVVDRFWTKMVYDGLKGVNIPSLFSSLSSAPMGAVTSSAAAPQSEAAEKKEEKKPDPVEEEDDDMDIGLGSMFD